MEVAVWWSGWFQCLKFWIWKTFNDQYLLHWRLIVIDSPSRTYNYYLPWVYRCWLFWSLLNVSFGILSKRYLVVPKGIEILQRYMHKGQSHFNFEQNSASDFGLLHQASTAFKWQRLFGIISLLCQFFHTRSRNCQMTQY
jgi:hypothetical protein